MISFGFDSTGVSSFNLQQGPDYDSNRIYITVKVSDNDGGSTFYPLTNNPITVSRDTEFNYGRIVSIISGSPENPINRILYSGSTKNVLSTINSLLSMVNSLSYSDENSRNSKIFHFKF